MKRGMGSATASGVDAGDFAVTISPAGAGVAHVVVQGKQVLLGVNTSSVIQFQ